MSNQLSQTALAKGTFYELMKDVATSIPGHILAYDPKTQSAQVQIGIVRVDVNGVEFNPPPLIKVPVHFCGGSNFAIEYQIDPGDEGIIVFSQRCIDGWKTTGGIAKNPIARFHDLSDAAFLPGIRPFPKAMAAFENNGIRIRNKDGTHYIWLKNDGAIEIKNTSGSLTISSAGEFNGEFTSFNVDSPSFSHNGVNIGETHKHIGNLGSPTSKPIE